MKKIYIILTATLLAACQEFQPVFTGEYADPDGYEFVTMEPTHTIAQLADMYTIGNPFVMDENIIIAGRVSTTDQPGNFYKSLYIEDETGAMELKIGKNGLYNDYKPGQTLYVKCNGLSLGMYGYKSGNYGGNGMVQIGWADPTEEYETSYIEVPLLIENHILRGELGDEVEPVEITASQLPGKNGTLKTCPYLGKLVTLRGLSYAEETFVLLYLDSNKDKKSYTNRVSLSDSNGVIDGDMTHGITTWAMSEAKMKEYLYSGIWDTCKVGSGSSYLEDAQGNVVTLGALRGENGKYDSVEKAAYSVSQYFTMSGTEVAIRTSGYCKFADTEIDPAVLSGEKTIDVTGVLTLYQGGIQLVVNNITDITVN